MITVDFGIGLSIGGIVGFIIREVVGYRLARLRASEERQINEFNKTVTKLKDAFLPVRMALNPSQFAIVGDLDDFLDTHFQSMRTSVIEFADVLDSKTKTEFLKAWYEYYCHQDARNENGVPFFEQYYWKGIKPEQESELMKLVLSRINALLEFAKHK